MGPALCAKITAEASPGYREMLGYLSPPCRCSPPASHPTLKTDGHRLAHAIDRTKISTRQYAKRQTSWIERRLLPPIASAENVHLCVLDATDLTRWSEVSGEAIKVYEGESIALSSRAL